jgi:hypothetical protein
MLRWRGYTNNGVVAMCYDVARCSLALREEQTVNFQNGRRRKKYVYPREKEEWIEEIKERVMSLSPFITFINYVTIGRKIYSTPLLLE